MHSEPQIIAGGVYSSDRIHVGKGSDLHLVQARFNGPATVMKILMPSQRKSVAIKQAACSPVELQGQRFCPQQARGIGLLPTLTA